MHILFTRFQWESAMGGAEIQTSSLMRGLKDRGHAVSFFGSCSVLLSLARGAGIQTTELPIGKPPVTKWSAISFLWRKRSMRQRLRRAIEGQSFDAVVMLSLSEKLLLTPLALSRGIHVYWLEHDRIGRWITANPWLKQLRALSASVTTIVVSDLSKELYLEMGWPKDRTIAIPNGIDMGRFGATDSSRQYENTGAVTTIGCIARLSEEKGVDLLIDAVMDIPETTLTVVGKGREEAYLRKKISEGMDGAERIRIVPEVLDPAAFYRFIDLLVLPSRDHDPFGLVAAEAMLCGTPVIVTDACGIAGYLQDGTDALVVPANSARALREAVVKMMDPAMRSRITEQGRRTAEEIFGLERMVETYEELIKMTNDQGPMANE